jgi:hypothetical protein
VASAARSAENVAGVSGKPCRQSTTGPLAGPLARAAKRPRAVARTRRSPASGAGCADCDPCGSPLDTSPNLACPAE